MTIKVLRMLRRTLYVASWQVHLGDGSNGSHILCNVVNEILAVFSTFSACLQSCKKDVHVVSLSIFKFRKTA
jgi:hypothetical protein